MKVFCVTVRFPVQSSFDLLAVHADSAEEAERKAQAAGGRLTGATTYLIDDYGVRFCNRVIE